MLHLAVCVQLQDTAVHGVRYVFGGTPCIRHNSTTVKVEACHQCRHQRSQNITR